METVSLKRFEEERKNHLLLQAKYLKLIHKIREIEHLLKMIPKEV